MPFHWTFLAFFGYTTRMPLFSRISPRYIYNYFPSVYLPTHLGVHNIRVTVVLNNANTLSLGTNSCKKMVHGSFEQHTSSKKAV